MAKIMISMAAPGVGRYWLGSLFFILFAYLFIITNIYYLFIWGLSLLFKGEFSDSKMDIA